MTFCAANTSRDGGEGCLKSTPADSPMRNILDPMMPGCDSQWTQGGLRKSFHGMKISLMILLALLLQGCVPLRQEALVSGPLPPLASLEEDKSLLIDINLRTEKIFTAGSFVMSPGGSRYTVRVKPHDYDLETKSSRIRARVYLYDFHGKQLQRWKNGVWSFHFRVGNERRNRMVDQQWRYWTFYYYPILHGPMN